MLAATGRTADVQGLGLESLGVALSRGRKVSHHLGEATSPVVAPLYVTSSTDMDKLIGTYLTGSIGPVWTMV